MMPNIIIHCLSILWNIILLPPYIKAWNIEVLRLLVPIIPCRFWLYQMVNRKIFH